MEGSELVVLGLNALVSIVVSGSFLGILQYKQHRRNLNSQSDVNEANAELIEGQVSIQISQEARELLNLYKDNAKEAREEAKKAEGRTDFLVKYLRDQGIAVPDWPVELR